MTILDKISSARLDFTTKSTIYPDTLCLGHLERRALIACFEKVYSLKPDVNSMKSGSMVYEGMTVVPVDAPSYLGVGIMMCSSELI